jgi:hypothetical protein
MNKSLRGGRRESSGKAEYGFRRVLRMKDPPGERIISEYCAPDVGAKKEPPFPAAFEVDNREASNRVTGATRCPNEDNASHKDESLTNRKKAIFFNFY